MGRGPDVAVGRAHGDAERVRDLGGAVGLVVADQTGKDREARGVRRRPGLGSPVVGIEIEDGAAVRLPPVGRGVPVGRAGFVEQPVVAIDDEQMPIAVRAATGNGSLDVAGLRLRFGRDRVSRGPSWCAIVALVPVRGPHGRDEGLIAGDNDVGNAVGRRPEVRVQAARRGGVAADAAADEVDVPGRRRIDRGAADIEVPPVRSREYLPPVERFGQRGRKRRRQKSHGRSDQRRREEACTHCYVLCRYSFHAAAK